MDPRPPTIDSAVTPSVPRLSEAATTFAEARVDAARLRNSLEVLSTFGRPAGGSFVDGVTRVAFSDADVAGREYAVDLMKAAGMIVRIDPAGNIVGRREGSDP